LNVDSVSISADGSRLDLSAGASEWLVAALAEGAVPEPYTAKIFVPVPGGVAGERPITVDQTNRSVIVGELLVVKWFLEPVPPPHRAPELLAHLAVAGFGHTARPYAAVYWQDRLIALVTAYLPEAQDGWDWCVDALMAGEDFAAELGSLAAELHAALAILPVAISGGEGWHQRAVDAAGEAARLTPGDDGQWLEFRAGEFSAALKPLLAVDSTPVMRIHGDFHVGQILKWRDGYAVIDFDGNPTVQDPDAPQPAARDVAQLLTSLEHVGQIAIKRRDGSPQVVADWVRAARMDFLTAYVARLSALGQEAIFDRRLLRAFEVEQECRELIYAARFLPRWTYAPMGVLRRWYG
jgi:maltokinase